MEQEWITVKELVEVLKGKLGRNSIYQAIASGAIPHVRVGKRILLRRDCLNQIQSNSGLADDN